MSSFDIIVKINYNQQCQQLKQQIKFIKQQSLIDALNSADVDKIDVQKLFELCKDIQSSQLKASIVLEALISSEYGQQGLDLLIQLLYAPNDQKRHKMLIQNEYLTQSRKASGYTNYVTGEANSQQNSRTHVTDYNTQKSNHSSLTTGGNVSNQVSGKGLQSKNGQGSNTSSLGTAPIHHTNANLTHKIDLSASLDLKNIQFKKIGANKIQNKQTFLEQYRKSKQLDTGDIGGSLPISQLISQNPNDLENRVSPMKQLHAKPQFEEKKQFKIAKPIQKGTGIKISRNIDQIINRNALNAPQGRSSVIKGAMDLSHNQTASHHHNLEDTLTSVHGNEGNMVQKAPMSSKFNQLLLTSSFNKNIIGGINNHKAGPTKIVSASINFQSHKNTNPGSFVGSARNN